FPFRVGPLASPNADRILGNLPSPPPVDFQKSIPRHPIRSHNLASKSYCAAKTVLAKHKGGALTYAPSQALACLPRNAFGTPRMGACFQQRPWSEVASFVMDSSRS